MITKKTFGYGIFAAALALAFAALSLAGCEGLIDMIDKELSGTVSISPGPSVETGTELTAVYNGEETVAYQWNKNGLAVPGAVSTKLTPAEAGDYTVTVNAEGYKSKTSAAVAVTVPGSGGPDSVTWTAAQTGGIDGEADTTGITFTFSAAVDSLNLTAADIAVSGAAAKGGAATFAKSGSNWLLSPITVNAAGTATVTITKPGIEAGAKNLTVYKAGETAPALTGITAVYTQGATVVTPDTPLNSLKAGLIVKAQYTGGGETTLSAGEYALSVNGGAFTPGENTVTVTYTDGVTVTAEFIVTVTEPIPEPDTGTPGLAYELIDNGAAYRVSKGSVTDGAVVIPATYNGLPVTEIGKADDYFENGAFNNTGNNTGITSIKIPASVTTIGGWAFAHSSLTEITIPAGVTTIGDRAFSFCQRLTEITIPASVTTIGDDAFTGCTGLATVTFAEGFAMAIGRWFDDLSSITTVNIGAGVTAIGDYAFSECINLTSVNIPTSVRSIGNSAFYGCRSLTEITIPASVTSIADATFCGTGLTSVTIPTSITSITRMAFASCSRLTEITIPASVTSIVDQAFAGCSSLTAVTFVGSRLITIGDGAFANCTSLTSITIPASVTTIGDGAFNRCTSLASINFNIPASVTTIGTGAFSGCSILASITIPASVTSVGGGAFSNWRITQTIYIEGHASQAAADTAWGNNKDYYGYTWRENGNATIKYWNGSSWQ